MPPEGAALLQRRYVSAGGVLVVDEPCEITTVLGPCVALTCWCPRSRVAGILHAMLPSPPPLEDGPPVPRWKYVVEAVPELLARFVRKGGHLPAAQCKLFGGADLLVAPRPESEFRVGARNVRAAQEFLAGRALHLSACDVGGPTGRKILFNTVTGGVRVKLLPGAAHTFR